MRKVMDRSLMRRVPRGSWLAFGLTLIMVLSCKASDEQLQLDRFRELMAKGQYEAAASLCYKAKVMMLYDTPTVVFTCAPEKAVTSTVPDPPKQEGYWPCTVDKLSALSLSPLKRRRGIDLYGRPIDIHEHAKEAPDDCYAYTTDNYTIVGFVRREGHLLICFIHFKS